MSELILQFIFAFFLCYFCQEKENVSLWFAKQIIIEFFNQEINWIYLHSNRKLLHVKLSEIDKSNREIEKQQWTVQSWTENGPLSKNCNITQYFYFIIRKSGRVLDNDFERDAIFLLRAWWRNRIHGFFIEF